MIGEKIKAFIDSKGLSDREFAINAKIQPEQMNRYIHNKNVPTIKTINKIKKAYPDFDSGVDEVINTDQSPKQHLIPVMYIDEIIKMKTEIVNAKNEVIQAKQDVIDVQKVLMQIGSLEKSQVITKIITTYTEPQKASR